MANSTRRCQVCRRYLPTDMLRVAGLGAVCREKCKPPTRRKKAAKGAKAKAERRARKYAPPKRGKSIKSGSKHVIPEPVRRVVLARDGGRCRYCSAATNTLHHIAYLSEQGPDFETNLIALCDEHHRLMHSSKRRWKPVLLAWIWLTYVEGRWLTVLEAEQIVSERRQPQ